ncbi:MAG: HEAT repeat domain-containing protein [Verrucomicrobiota bacterium]
MKSWIFLFAALCLTSCVTLNPLRQKLTLDDATHDRCVEILRKGIQDPEHWPAIHAAEGLTLGGYGGEVLAYFDSKNWDHLDDQQKCGVARERVRAGHKEAAQVMIEILEGDDPFGHTHAAESLYKVGIIGDCVYMRKRFEDERGDIKLRLMAAAALAKKGDREAFVFLRDSMQSDDEDTYRIAAWILGRVGGKRDIALLKSRLGDSDDPVVEAYLNNSLAALGDAEGLAALEANLGADDPALRTYAATFAGDARAYHLAPKLQQLLDDPHLDARYRAAQSLLYLSR